VGEEVIEHLKHYVEKIKSKGYPLRSLVLFGSRARGEHLKESDVDVLVIVDIEDMDFIERMRILSRLWDAPYALEVFAYTLEEVKGLINRGSIHIYDALEHGIVIYDDGTFEYLRKKFKEAMDRGIVKRDIRGWWTLPKSRVI